MTTKAFFEPGWVEQVNAFVSCLDRRVADIYGRYYGGDGSLFVPSRRGLAGMRQALADIQRDVTESSVGDFWACHFRQLLDALEYALVEDPEKPSRYIERMTRHVRETIALLGDGSKARELERYFCDGVSVLAELESMVRECDSFDGFLVARSSDLLRQDLASAKDGIQAAGLSSSANELDLSLAKTAQAAEGAKGNATPKTRPFDEVVRRAFAWDVDEVLSWYKEDLELCLHEFNELAGRLDPRRPGVQILEEDLGPCASSEEMMALAAGYVSAAREGSAGYIILPEGETMLVESMDPAFRVSCPWGVYSDEGMRFGHLVGRLQLNVDNYKAVTKGWLQMMAVHEGYPGHHSHFVKTMSRVDLPASFTTQTTAADYVIEGIAHRSERLLEGLFPDAAYPLFVAFRRLHCALRIKAELDLHLHKNPMEDTISEYMNIMGFDRSSAEVQTQAHMVLPGRALSYYTGMRTLEQAQRLLDLDPSSFTETIFSHGKIPLDTMLAIVEMSPTERAKTIDLDIPYQRN